MQEEYLKMKFQDFKSRGWQTDFQMACLTFEFNLSVIKLCTGSWICQPLWSINM